MKKTAVLTVILVLVASVVFAGKKMSTTLNIIPEGKITVDASLADWAKAGVKPTILDKKSMLTHGAAEWLGAEKQSGEVYVAFTEENLYIAAKVMAPKGIYNNNPGKDMWNGNAVEVFVGFDNSEPNREMYTEADYQIGLSPGRMSKNKETGKMTVKNPAEVYCFNMETAIKGSKIKVKAIKGGYIVEAMVPGSFFEAWDVADGNEIGFDISIDDVGAKGAARKLQFTWSGYKESWKDPAGWGKATLAE